MLILLFWEYAKIPLSILLAEKESEILSIYLDPNCCTKMMCSVLFRNTFSLLSNCHGIIFFQCQNTNLLKLNNIVIYSFKFFIYFILFLLSEIHSVNYLFFIIIRNKTAFAVVVVVLSDSPVPSTIWSSASK